MRTTNSVVAVLGAAGLMAGLVSAAGATTPAEPRAGRGVCAGVKGCYVMGHVDVTGDGKRDWVGAVNRNGRTIEKGKVTVRLLAMGRLSKKTLTVRHWRGDVFHGIARIDGRGGAELVVGANRKRYRQRTRGGAKVTYAKAFHVVTVRHGELVRSEVPGKKSRSWWLTPADGVSSGRFRTGRTATPSDTSARPDTGRSGWCASSTPVPASRGAGRRTSHSRGAAGTGPSAAAEAAVRTARAAGT